MPRASVYLSSGVFAGSKEEEEEEESEEVLEEEIEVLSLEVEKVLALEEEEKSEEEAEEEGMVSFLQPTARRETRTAAERTSNGFLVLIINFLYQL